VNAIDVRHVRKIYKRYGRRKSFGTLKSAILTGRVVRDLKEADAFEALKGVSFEVAAGKTFGIVGRNGSGKSTMLKLIAGIGRPTSGDIKVNGRLSALIELGAGFHPEISGRDNVFINGMMLGLSKREVASRFDEIVAFAELEDFIDEPVKTYSSGMYMRLGFSVAINVDPDVLLVDEVLAVGDADFQKKCLGKMGDVAEEGRTVLFVSHNMPAVQALCARAILLRAGTVAVDGSTGEVLREYLGHLLATAAHAFEDNPDRRGDGSVRLTAARVLDEEGRPCERVVAGKPITLEFSYENPIGAERFDFALAIVNHLNIGVAHMSTPIAGFSIVAGAEGVVTCRIPTLPLPQGEYRVVTNLRYQGQQTDHIPNALAFSVESSVFFKTGRVPKIEYGAALFAHEWGHQAGQVALTDGAVNVRMPG